jgi:hypothetical protein
MPQHDEATFVLHGLDVDNRNVRADVFARKLRTLLTGLQTADKSANGRISYTYMIGALAIGSASATIRQKQKHRDRPAHSPIAVYESAASAVYNGDPTVERLSPPLVRQIQRLGQGVARSFSHAELAFAEANVIRIDDFLLKQSEQAVRAITGGGERAERYFRGLVVGSFDGLLKEIDARGTMLRGKLVLSAGAVEVDCVMNKERVPEARESFDKRVIIEGAAHYDGENQLPARVDVRTIRIVGDQAGLARWRGAFRAPAAEDDAEENW